MAKVRVITKRWRIDVDRRLTRRLFAYMLAEVPVAWRSKFELDHRCARTTTTRTDLRDVIVFAVFPPIARYQIGLYLMIFKIV